MKNLVIGVVVLILLVIGGWFLFGRGRSSMDTELLPEPTLTPALSPIGDEVSVNFEPNKARTKAILTISGLDKARVKNLEYEVLYETSGLVKGVNSGSSPVEADANGEVERELTPLTRPDVS